LKNEDDVLTLTRRKSNSPRLYRISSAYPRVVTCTSPDSGAARYQQFTSCLLEGLYGTFSSPRKIFQWIRITDQKTCLNVHNTFPRLASSSPNSQTTVKYRREKKEKRL